MAALAGPDDVAGHAGELQNRSSGVLQLGMDRLDPAAVGRVFAHRQGDGILTTSISLLTWASISSATEHRWVEIVSNLSSPDRVQLPPKITLVGQAVLYYKLLSGRSQYSVAWCTLLGYCHSTIR